MNIYAVLKRDHEKLEELLSTLVDFPASDASSEAEDEGWKTLLAQIQNELVSHSRAEEVVLYDRLQDDANGKGVVAQAYGDHAQAEAELRRLWSLTAVNAKWIDGAAKLRGDVLAHIVYEEGLVWPEAQKRFTPDEANRMGEELERHKRCELMEAQAKAG